MGQVLRHLAPFDHPWVDTRVGPMEDAALLRPPSGSPLVFTVDFITPVVDEPEAFGAIAAANSLSDVYAMGGEPQVALALCGFPDDRVPLSILERIFRGGRDKAAEAGCAIAGGHTVIDPELKYGLCVLGALDPKRSLAQTGGRPGDRLLLSKPIGFGVAAQALKKQALAPAERDELVRCMAALNRGAKDAALASGAHAATDVTGFGLLGHLHHLAAASGCSARVEAAAVPRLAGSRERAEAGFVPGGSRRNLSYVEPHVRWDAAVDPLDRLLLCDAQTSGGLLIAVPAERAEELSRALADRGAPAHACVGELREGAAGAIEVAAGS